jgi:hypothetical protein
MITRIHSARRLGLTSAWALALGAMLSPACGGSPSQPSASPPTAVAPPPTSPATGGAQPPSPAPAAATRIAFSFKLDPLLGGGTYGGEVWVSPVTYTGAVGQSAVVVRAGAVDANGSETSISPDWIASDPAMVTVSPTRGDQVTLTVLGPGDSTVVVMAGDLSRQLRIRATERSGGGVQLEIAQ